MPCIIARDHRTDLNRPREYRTGDERCWTPNRLHAKRWLARERDEELTWIRKCYDTTTMFEIIVERVR